MGLNNDRSIRELKGANRPILTKLDRAAILAALKSVNDVFILDDLLATSFLRTAMPDVYVKGGDYTVGDLPAEVRAVVNELAAASWC